MYFGEAKECLAYQKWIDYTLLLTVIIHLRNCVRYHISLSMKKLFAFVMLGSNDLNKSDKFYDAVAIYLGMIAINSADKFIFLV